MSDKTKLTMSLDDVIKMSKEDRRNQNRRQGNRRGNNRNLFFRNKNRKGSDSNVNPQRSNLRGGNQRRFKQRFAGQKRIQRNPILKKKFIKKTGPEGEEKRQVEQHRNKETVPRKKTEIRISGLHLNISNSELYELFSQFGPMKKCRIDYDQLGRSYGTAIIQYEKTEHAEKAVEDYNGAELDGHKLYMEFVQRESEREVPGVQRRPTFKRSFNRRFRRQ